MHLVSYLVFEDSFRLKNMPQVSKIRLSFCQVCVCTCTSFCVLCYLAYSGQSLKEVSGVFLYICWGNHTTPDAIYCWRSVISVTLSSHHTYTHTHIHTYTRNMCTSRQSHSSPSFLLVSFLFLPPPVNYFVAHCLFAEGKDSTFLMRFINHTHTDLTSLNGDLLVLFVLGTTGLRSCLSKSIKLHVKWGSPLLWAVA